MIRHQAPDQAHNRGVQTAQTDPIPTLLATQPGTRSKPVTLPKSPVTFAEMRSCGQLAVHRDVLQAVSGSPLEETWLIVPVAGPTLRVEAG